VLEAGLDAVGSYLAARGSRWAFTPGESAGLARAWAPVAQKYLSTPDGPEVTAIVVTVAYALPRVVRRRPEAPPRRTPDPRQEPADEDPQPSSEVTITGSSTAGGGIGWGAPEPWDHEQPDLIGER